MWFGIVTLFPDMFSALDWGITGRAREKGSIQIDTFQPREFAADSRRTVDDRPYGGGPGMVMQAAPLRDAIRAAKKAAPCPPRVIYLSPQGKLFTQEAAAAFAAESALVFVSGRYEGIDERLYAIEPGEQWSLGNYVLSGGELAAMAMMDAIIRLLPGVLGHPASATQDSLCTGLLEHPQYTRPEILDGLAVPAVLLTGDHAAIARWRLKTALGRTFALRPEMLAKRAQSLHETVLLAEYLQDTMTGQGKGTNCPDADTVLLKGEDHEQHYSDH